MITAIIIDGQTSCSVSICNLLEEQGIKVYSIENSYENGYKKILLLQPDLVIIDPSLEGCRGLFISRKAVLKKLSKVAIFSRDYLDLGIKSFLYNKSIFADLLTVLREILSSDGYFHNINTSIPMTPNTVKPLSKREQQIMDCIALADNVKETALKLKLSPKTIYYYRKRILNKLNLKDTLDLINYIYRNLS